MCVCLKGILVGHQIITWVLCQTEGMTKTVVAQILALRGAPFEVAKSGPMVERTEACQIDGDLTQISVMTLTDQMNFVMTSIQTSDLATAYVNLRDGEARPKKRNGDVVVPARLSLLITGSSMREIAEVQIVDQLDLGMDVDLQMSDFLMILRMHDTEEDGMKGKKKM